MPQDTATRLTQAQKALLQILEANPKGVDTALVPVNDRTARSLVQGGHAHWRADTPSVLVAGPAPESKLHSCTICGVYPDAECVSVGDHTAGMAMGSGFHAYGDRHVPDTDELKARRLATLRASLSAADERRGAEAIVEPLTLGQCDAGPFAVPASLPGGWCEPPADAAPTGSRS